MAVDADSASRELMQSTTPGHREMRSQPTWGRTSRTTGQVSWEVLCHRVISVNGEMPVVQHHAHVVDCRQSAPPYRSKIQLGNSNG